MMMCSCRPLGKPRQITEVEADSFVCALPWVEARVGRLKDVKDHKPKHPLVGKQLTARSKLPSKSREASFSFSYSCW